MNLYVYLTDLAGRNSVAGIATGCGLEGPGIATADSSGRTV